MSTSDVSLRVVIDAKRRLDELGTARLLGEIAETVHKTQKQGQPIGRLTPEAIVVRDGAIALELPAAPVATYSAPERLRGGSGDRRSDVFSLGVLLWEALAHVPLFASEAEVQSKAVPPVTEMNANVPAELDAICKKALARDPADRYQSAKVMAAEISAVLDDAGYPEGLDEITKWIAKEAPAPRGTGTQPPPSVTRPPFNPGTTAVGMAPVKIEDKKAVDDKTMPLQSVDLVEVKAAPKAPIEKDESSPHVLPQWAKNTSPPPIQGSPIASAPTVGVPAMPTPLATAPAVPLAAAAAAATPAPMPAAANPAPLPANAAPLTGAAPMPAKAPAPVVLAAAAPAAKSAPVPAAPILPAAPIVPAAPILPPALAAAAPSLATASPTQTLTGVSSAQLLPAKLLSKPPADEPMILTTPTAPGVDMPAVAAAQNAIATPIVNTPPSAPVLKLPDMPPGATVSANSPPVFATTAIAGSGALSGPAVAPEPAKYDGTRTAILGSNAIIEATNAAVSAANPPVQVPAPTPLVVPKSELPIPFKPKPGISNAVTVATDQVRDTIRDPITKETPSPSQPLVSVAVAVEAPAPPSAPVLPSASRPSESDVAKSVNVVSVRSQRGDPSRGDKSGTGKGDVLAGWGWGTDSHQAYEDDAYEDDGKKTKKRLMVAVGGALAAVLVVTVVAFAMGGGGKDKDKKTLDDVATKPAVDPSVNPEPPKPPDPKPEPVKQDPPPVDPNAGAVQPPVANEPDPKTDPKQDVKTDPVTDPKQDPTKTDPKVEDPKADPNADPKAIAKTDPKADPKADPKKDPKADPKKDPKALAKTDPKKDPKADPKKDPKAIKQDPKADPKLTKKDPPKKEPKKEPKKDPVAIKKQPDPKKDLVKTEPKVDAASAYKTGLRQMAGGDSSGALATFKASLASDPGFAPTWRGIGMVYEKLGKKSQASTAFKRYLQLSPNAGDAEQIRTRLEKLGS